MCSGGQTFDENVPEEIASICVGIEANNLNRLVTVCSVIKQQLDSPRVFTGRATGNGADIDSNTGTLPRTRGLPPVREVAVSRAAMSWDFKIATAT
jgi:hypothetical protein